MSKIENLDKIDLSDNDITNIPEGLFLLREISEIDLSGNEISKKDQYTLERKFKNTDIKFQIK